MNKRINGSIHAHRSAFIIFLDRVLYSSASERKQAHSQEGDMRTLTRQVSVDLNVHTRLWLARGLCALALTCCLSSVAAAYTIVMRGGRRIEAPAHFVLTPTALTYEAAPGLNVTLPLAEIDIAATERANNEPPGSLLRRAQATTATVK